MSEMLKSLIYCTLSLCSREGIIRNYSKHIGKFRLLNRERLLVAQPKIFESQDSLSLSVNLQFLFIIPVFYSRPPCTIA